MINSDKIIAEEYRWVFENEPTFHLNGNILSGKVGRSPNGDSIIIAITLPQYYPIIRPNIEVLTKINHPNIDQNMNLSLQILEEWDPSFRLKDIVAHTRRLFIKSKNSISTSQKRKQNTGSSYLEDEILVLQKQINDLNKKITEVKGNRLQQAGINGINSLKVTQQSDLNAQLLALKDLLELLEIKFEEADIDQTDFFRLYRKYIKEKYICSHKLLNLEVNNNYISEKKTKRPIRH